MTRKSKKVRNRASRRSRIPRVGNHDSSAIQMVAGDALLTVTSGSNIGNVSFTTTTLTRLGNIADVFMLWRFVELKITPVVWEQTTTTTAHWFAYTVDPVNAAPTLALEVASIGHSIGFNGRSTQSRGPTLHLTRKELQGIVPWYRTVAGAPEDQLEFHGTLYQYTPDASGVHQYHVEYVVELKDMVAPLMSARPPRPLTIQQFEPRDHGSPRSNRPCGQWVWTEDADDGKASTVATVLTAQVASDGAQRRLLNKC